MNIQLQKAKSEDIPLITSLAHKIWKAYYPAIITNEQIDYMLDKFYSTTSLDEQMNDGQDFYLINSDGTSVGYLSVAQQNQGDYFLNKFYIDPNEHRKNIGENTFLLLLDLLPDLKTMRLTVNRSNFKSINFYFKLGFIIKEVKDFDIGNNYFMNDFIMIYKTR
jgi:ribosomal protein S18 acetylase RimI-like enzyme